MKKTELVISERFRSDNPLQRKKNLEQALAPYFRRMLEVETERPTPTQSAPRR